MITAGDRIAVGVSGGKDSRTLLDLLHRGINIPGSYEIVAVHVDGTDAGLPSMRPDLEAWFQQLGVPYDFPLLEVPAGRIPPDGLFPLFLEPPESALPGSGPPGVQ